MLFQKTNLYFGDNIKNSFCICSADEVGLLQNAAFVENENEINSISIASGLANEEPSQNTNMLTITGEDGLVYQVRI